MKYGTFFFLASFMIFYTVSVSAHDVQRNPIVCGLNEVRAPCGKECEDRCNANRPQYCHSLVCKNHECRCKDGFVRNPYTNVCVPRYECARDGCARGEIFASCGRLCEGTCRKPFLPPSCEMKVCHTRECRCDLKGGFFRNKRTGQCVRLGGC